MSLPAGVVVSIDCWSRYRSTPQASSVWIVPSKSMSERPSRSIAHAITTSKERRLVEPGTPVTALGAANASVAVFFDNLPTPPFGDLAQFPELVFDRLLVS